MRVGYEEDPSLAMLPRDSPFVGCSVPEWEELVYTPGVFVRAANKGVTAYGTWKSIRKNGEGLGRRGRGG